MEAQSCSAFGQLHCKGVCRQGGWELTLQYFWGSDERKWYFEIYSTTSLWCESLCDSYWFIRSQRLRFLPTFILGGLSKFQLNIAENKDVNVFTHQVQLPTEFYPWTVWAPKDSRLRTPDINRYSKWNYNPHILTVWYSYITPKDSINISIKPRCFKRKGKFLVLSMSSLKTQK